jgi:4-amino-4-deoxy-L-arabinose transferase-like glycosyltransferase
VRERYRPIIAWTLWTLAVTLVFGRIGAYNLGNYRPISNDEMELMAVAYKLATQGVLGSDLYAGFFGADQHFLITLPLQHLADATSFKLFGAGVAQMRWVSLVAGVSLVWVVSWLAYRWYGLGTAIVGDLLLVAWPSNLTSAPNGLPLLGVARAARYDVLAVAFAWLAIALLYALLRRPRRVIAFGLGICCGLAALAQFMGAFVLPLVALNWVWARGRRGLTEPTLYWAVAGLGVVVLPWIVVVTQYHADWSAQLTVFGGDRWDVLNPRFYVSNLVNEPLRYQNVLRLGPAEDPSAPTSPVSQSVLALAVWPAAAYLAWRSRRTRAIGDRLLWSSLVIFGGLLLLVDQTKTPLYAIILLPSICLAIAVSCKLVPRVLLVGLGLVIAIEGANTYHIYLTQASQVSQYLGVGVELDVPLAPGARILGPERWWWALHAHPYASLRSLWWQWWAEASASQNKSQLPQFATWATSTQADVIIVNDNVRDDIHAFPDALQQQFWAFVSSCTTPVLDLTDASYLRIEVDRITRPPPDLEICGGRT